MLYVYRIAYLPTFAELERLLKTPMIVVTPEYIAIWNYVLQEPSFIKGNFYQSAGNTAIRLVADARSKYINAGM